MKKVLICLVVGLMAQWAEAQTFSRYIIQFRNKQNNTFSVNNPTQFLSQRALDRRIRYGISIDSTDLPVTGRYIDSVRLSGSVTILNASRWLNQVSIQTTDAAALQKINSFPFVQMVAPIAARITNVTVGEIKTGKTSLATKERDAAMSRTNSWKGVTPYLLQKKAVSLQEFLQAQIGSTASSSQPQSPNSKLQTAADFYNYGLSYNQVNLHNGEFLHNIGLRGQGMRIGILDAGFRNYTSLRSFDSVNATGRVLGTYDFVARETSVVEDDAHGMQCFSIIAANIPGQFVGTAPQASFYLYRSEDPASEYPIEEHNWVCAAERVDSAGGDLISSSLGYSNGMSNPQFDHTYAEMNGNTTIAARGADLAAKKGVLVANSAGNDGQGSFHFISTPADGDSVLAVGAVNSSGTVAPFSSFGPSSDGQVKPDVASFGVGTTLQAVNNTIGTGNGTSFSCPNIAGLAACLWQGFQEVNNIRILNALRQAGSKASNPDDRVGFGIPDVKKAVLALLKEFSTASVVPSSPCRHTITWTSKDVSTMKYEIERQGPGQNGFIKIGEKAGTGNVFGIRTHQFIDSALSVSPGLVTYRIRQIADTATVGFAADYIDTISLQLNTTCGVTSINPQPQTGVAVRINPNPATTQITVQLTTPFAVLQLLLRVVNAKGQTVLTQRESKTSGTTQYTLNVAGIARGAYYLQLFNGDKIITTTPFIRL